MFYSRPQILKCLIIKGWKYLLGGLINHTPLLIPVFSSQFNIYHQFVQFCCLRQNALQHQVKHYVWLYLCYIYAVNLDSKISVIKTVFFNKIKISLLVLPLLSYLFNQVWVVPFFFFFNASTSLAFPLLSRLSTFNLYKILLQHFFFISGLQHLLPY